MITKEQVLKVAALAHLRPTEDEVSRLTKNLNSILDYVERLAAVDVKDIVPMSHVHGSTNVFREDAVTPSFPIERVLQNAPDAAGRFIRVPIVVGQSEEH